tara:strand:+ start:435 stop:2018 length:1584 start_codon:yes stop_codon:yes gene_type:complete
MILRNIFLVVLLSCFYSNLYAVCTTETAGLCTPGTTSETSGSEVTDTIVTNQDSGDILDGSNGYVTSTKEGDMDSDWGGQGSASMPSGNSCYGLGTDKCAQITGSGNTTSTMGVSGMGTTFINTINISDLTITHGGETNYTIKVDKQDPDDRIYLHVTGKYGGTEVFTGTDVLSESGITSGYQQYSGSFDFAGAINSIVVEIGGRDISLAVGPVFDDVSINILYNVVTTIVNQQIQELEEFLVLDYGQDVNDVAEMIFDNNKVTDDFNFQPIEAPVEEFSFESVEMEMQEFEMDFQTDMDMNMEYDMPDIVIVPTNMDMDMEMPMEITVSSVEMDIEMEMDIPEPEQMEVVNIEPTEEPIVENTMDNESTEPEAVQEDISEPEMEPEQEQPEEVEEAEPEEIKQETKEVAPEPEQEPEPEPEEVEKLKEEPKKEPTAKQKAATKIVKDMGDRGRYEAGNQLKTLIVMQVLGDTKTFFDSQKMLQDTEGFFTNDSLPDTILTSNNIAQYMLFGKSNTTMERLIDSQYK